MPTLIFIWFCFTGKAEPTAENSTESSEPMETTNSGDSASSKKNPKGKKQKGKSTPSPKKQNGKVGKLPRSLDRQKGKMNDDGVEGEGKGKKRTLSPAVEKRNKKKKKGGVGNSVPSKEGASKKPRKEESEAGTTKIKKNVKETVMSSGTPRQAKKVEDDGENVIDGRTEGKKEAPGGKSKSGLKSMLKKKKVNVSPKGGAPRPKSFGGRVGSIAAYREKIKKRRSAGDTN